MSNIDTLKQAAHALRKLAEILSGMAAQAECQRLAAALEAMADCPQDPPQSERQATLSRTGDGQDRAEHDAQVRNAALRKMVDTMFTSGNAIPVERITITRKQFEEALKTTGDAA